MRRRANVLLPELESSREHGFAPANDVDLGDFLLGRDYAASVLVSKYVPGIDVAGARIEDDMIDLSAAYEELLARGALSFEADAGGGPQVLGIYVGRGAHTNFETAVARLVGMARGPTGLNPPSRRSILFGRGYTGAAEVDSAACRRRLSERGGWPARRAPRVTDESVMPDGACWGGNYPWKFRFSLLGEDHSGTLQAGEAFRRMLATPSGGVLSIADMASWLPRGIPLLERYLQGGRDEVILTPLSLKELGESFWTEVERVDAVGPRSTLAFLAAALSSRSSS